MKKVLSILLTVTMLVSVVCSFGVVYAEDSLTTPYGTIGADYANAQSYPWVLFQADGTFVGGYNTFGTTSGGGVLGSARWYDGCTIYLRRDLSDSGRYFNSIYHPTNNIDLGGHTLTLPAGNSMFEMMNKGSGGNPVINVSNGTIVLKSKAMFDFSESSPKTASSVKIQFTNVTFKLAENASLSNLISTYSSSALSKAMTSTMEFTNCVFDMTENVPSTGINLIGAGDASNTMSVNVVVNGCTVKATSADGLTVSSVGNNNSKVVFCADNNGDYLKLELPSDSVASSESFLLDTGSYGMFLLDFSDDAIDYYEIGVLEVIPTEYGDIPAEYASVDDYPFVVFNADKTFQGAYTKWSQSDGVGALPAARWAGDGCVILMRRNYAHGDISAYPNLSNANHTHNLDLGGYTLTISSRSSGLFYAHGKAHSDVTTVNIKNGSIKVNSESIVHTWAGAGKTFNFNFTNVNIGFTQNAKPSNLICVNAKQEYSNYTTNFTFDKCNIDFKTNAPAGMEACFEVGTSYAVENNNFILKDCTVTVPNTDTVPLYTVGNENSSIVFGSSDGERYLTLTTDASASKPGLDFVTTAEGNAPVLALYDATSSLKTYYLTTKPALMTPYGEIPFKYESTSTYPWVMFDANGNFKAAYDHWGGNTATGMLGDARWYDGATILLRTDYKMSNTNGRDNYPNLGHHVSTNTIDLGGNTFDTSASGYTMFNFATRDNKGDNALFVINVKNGTIKLGKNPVAEFSYGGGAAQNYNVNYSFEDVTFDVASGATLSSLFGFSNTSATDRFLNVNLNLEDCTYNVGVNIPADGITLFNAGDNNGNTTVTLNVIGGNITADNYAGVKLSGINNSASKINFAVGSEGKLLTATVAADKDVTHEPVASNGKKYAFANRVVADGVATYTIAETDDFEMWLKDASVEVYNITGACKLYLASYVNNEISLVHIFDVTENAEFDIPGEFTGYDTLKAFLWNGENIEPLCVAQWK